MIASGIAGVNANPNASGNASGNAGVAAPAVTVTIDVEDYDREQNLPHFERAMDALLGLLDERSVKATAFIVGTLATFRPSLVERIAGLGHEIGVHGHAHQTLDSFDPQTFGALSADVRRRLEDLAGAPVVGYRAPHFSLTPSTSWAPAALLEAGYQYSSSVLPTRGHHRHVGYSKAPRGPFRWGCGLLELPCGLFAGIPVGGAYLRIAPAALSRLMVRRAARRTPWVYVHPHDFATDEPFAVMPEHSWFESRVLFARRKVMLDRLTAAFGANAAPPLKDRLDEIGRRELPVLPG